MFVSALFVVLKNQKQLKSSFSRVWLYKLWNIGSTEYYIVVKKHEVNLYVNKAIHVKHLAQCQAHSKGSINVRY